MNKKVQFIDRQWRMMKWFFIVWPFWCAMILGLNIWDDANAGRPFNWTNFASGLGIALFGGVVFMFGRLIFRFLRSVYDDGPAGP
ncbi:MAG: hypothetical protein V4659_05330 [Pseudomonadota bacterium]